jgi:hypothetical protein
MVMSTIAGMVCVRTTQILLRVSLLFSLWPINQLISSIAVDAVPSLDSKIQLHSFRDNKRPEFRGETLDSPVGVALLEWNSRLGVPTNVWIAASTAVVHCTSCDLTRSFPAHRLHLDSGVCNDPGQALTVAGADEDDDH